MHKHWRKSSKLLCISRDKKIFGYSTQEVQEGLNTLERHICYCPFQESFWYTDKEEQQNLGVLPIVLGGNAPDRKVIALF